MAEYTVMVASKSGEIFASDAFDQIVGQPVTFTSPRSGNRGFGLLKSAEVNSDGTIVTLTIEFEEV